jgi:hypothetical protein
LKVFAGDDALKKNYKRFFPALNKEKIVNGYDFFISEDESVIYKKNNQSSERLNKIFRDNTNMDFFLRIMDGIGLPTPLRPHIVNGFELEDDGSHKSPFLHGYRLDLLDSYELSDEEFKIIITETERLLSILLLVSADNELTGDWALHNLIFSLSHKRIMNVDLEGFVTYNPIPVWADIEIITEWIRSIQRLRSI